MPLMFHSVRVKHRGSVCSQFTSSNTLPPPSLRCSQVCEVLAGYEECQLDLEALMCALSCNPGAWNRCYLAEYCSFPPHLDPAFSFSLVEGVPTCFSCHPVPLSSPPHTQHGSENNVSIPHLPLLSTKRRFVEIHQHNVWHFHLPRLC